ncbi:ribonuclease HII [Ferroglobus sp.]|uniref:ribonuclease HII n=1 Tax=Ferroglobus sp. TaxID=2614230 RepID=UPI0025B7FA1A|nr:ribonuclease HII [Ferroglobus sp.]
MKIAGIDEAGKGPVIGPLVVCGVLCEEKEVEALKKLGVKDSKKLSPERRREIAEKLKRLVKYEVIVISPQELNSKMERMTLNEILKEVCAKIISKLNPDVVFVDSFDVKPERLEDELKQLTGKEVIAMHEGEREVIVAAASIIAKCLRDEMIEELKRKYGDFGSGYASDEKTRRWLEDQIKKGEIPEIVRKKWKTVEKIRQKLGQKSLFEF